MGLLDFEFFESNETNTAPIVIFTVYGLTIFTCVALIARTLQGAYNDLPIAQRTRSHLPVRRNDVLASGTLAILSFALNAYHVIDALVTSYNVWSLQKKYVLPTNIWTAAAWFPRLYSTSNELRLGNWLKDTDWLQEVAFAVAGRSRDFWWAQQLSAATMIWSTFIAIEGRRRNIPYLWTYILLAHLVGLSFAQNLFNIVLLLTPLPIERKRKRTSSSTKSITWTPHPLLFITPFLAAMFCTALFPYMEDNRSLFVFSAIPATLTFAPLFITKSNFVPASWGKNHSSIHRAHSSSLPAFAFSSRLAVILHLLMTFASVFFNTPPARQTNPNLIWNTQSFTSLTTSTRLRIAVTRLLGSLSDNPVVRKIGWDVILSGVSLCTWAALRGPDISDMLSAAGVPGVQAMTGAVKELAESAVTMAGNAQETLSSAANDVTEAAISMKESAMPMLESAKDAAISMKESAIPMLESAKDAIASTAQDVADSDAIKQMTTMAQDAAASAKEMTSAALTQLGLEDIAASTAVPSPGTSRATRGRGRPRRGSTTATNSPPRKSTRRTVASTAATAAKALKPTAAPIQDDDSEDDSEDEDYAPSRRAAAAHEEHEHEEVHGPVELSEGTESAALAWGMLVLGGLGVAGSGVWGAELVGR